MKENKMELVQASEEMAVMETTEAQAVLKGLSIRALLLRPDIFGQLEKLAETMAGGKCTIPDHLQNNPADCLAIIMQAAQWGMNPWPVAQKTHLINGTLGYEAQLVNAVVISSGILESKFEYEFFGAWEKILGKVQIKYNDKKKPFTVPGWRLEDEEGLGVKVSAVIKGKTGLREIELLLKQATVRNSTLWASDPKQQLAYLAVKRWARLHAPETIMGVYTPDELEEVSPREEINVTPQGKTQTDKLKNILTKNGKEGETEEKPQGMAIPAKEPAKEEDFFRRLRDALNQKHITDPFFLQGLELVHGFKTPGDIPEGRQEEIIKWVLKGCPDR